MYKSPKISRQNLVFQPPEERQDLLLKERDKKFLLYKSLEKRLFYPGQDLLYRPTEKRFFYPGQEYELPEKKYFFPIPLVCISGWL